MPMTAGPHQRGFNYFYGILDHLAGHFHYPSESRDVFEYNGYASNPEWKNIKDQVPKTAYSTDLFAARAKRWVVAQRKFARKTGQPFTWLFRSPTAIWWFRGFPILPAAD